MNIDVRNIKGEVLKSMNRLIKQHGFKSTAKATRFVLVDYYTKLEMCNYLEAQFNQEKKELLKKLKQLKQELADKNRLLKKHENFKLELEKYLKKPC